MSENIKCQGVIVPLATPFTPEGQIDADGVCRLIDHLIAGGVEGIFVLGTTGEAPSIPAVEKIKLVEIAVEHTKNRATVYAGISSNCFHESVTMGNCFMDLGADVLAAHPPCYYPLGDEELLRYFMNLADDVDGPLMLYNIPATTKLSLSIDTAEQLSRHERIIGLKDSENTPGRLEAAMERFAGQSDFSYVVGCAALSAKGLALGAAGIVPSGANLYPRLYHSLFEAARDGDEPAADKLQQQTDRASAVYQGNKTLGQSLAALKAALHILGVCGPTVLPPLETLGEEDIAELRKQMAAAPPSAASHDSKTSKES
jgi:dihydrodipicolinate synthase/N-acetylneuraminate lyase